MLRSHRLRAGVGWLVLAATVGLGWQGWRYWYRPEPLRLPTVPISRGSVAVSLTAPGTVQAVNRTELNCELEEIPLDGYLGHGINILEMMPEGTRVKKGDVLCRLDDSRYQELVRRQRIRVMRDEADFQNAALEREAAEVALRSFREGEARQKNEEFRGQIALLESDLERARERLAWTENLSHLGYTTSAQVASDKATLLRLEVQLENARASQTNFETFIYPRSVRQLEVQVEVSERRRLFYEMQLRASRERLAHYEDLIVKSTIHTPHDGILIYASMINTEQPKLTQVGHVHQGMKMFYLPDMSRLVAMVQLHESVAPQVRVGMAASVRLEALPDREIRGRVIAIDPVPVNNWRAGLVVLQFRAQVELLDPPAEILPEMSLEARIITGTHRDTLVVPSQALAIEDGSSYCFVQGPDGDYQRRLVTLDPGDEDVYSVVSGLSEGEQLVLDPSPLRTHPDSLDPMHDTAPSADEQTSTRLPAPPEDHPA